MIKKKSQESNFEQVDAIISENFELEGNIVAGNSLRLEGKIRGNVSISGSLIVGKNASVEGNINASNVQIIGKVKGNVKSQNQLKLFSSAILLGDIEVSNFIMDQGAVFLGTCNMASIDNDLKEEVNQYKNERNQSQVAITNTLQEDSDVE